MRTTRVDEILKCIIFVQNARSSALRRDLNTTSDCHSLRRQYFLSRWRDEEGNISDTWSMTLWSRQNGSL